MSALQWLILSWFGQAAMFVIGYYVGCRAARRWRRKP